MHWSGELPSKEDFARLIRSGHGRAALLAKSGHGNYYKKQIVDACLFDRREEIDCAGLGSYLAKILQNANIDAVGLLTKRANNRVARRHRRHALSILASLARRGDEKAKDLKATIDLPAFRFRSGYWDREFKTFEEFCEYAYHVEPPTFVFSRFARKAADAELLKAAKAISEPQSKHFLHGLLGMFDDESRPFPFDPSILIQHAKSDVPEICFFAMSALSHLAHPKIRQFAEWCFREHYALDDAIELFILNQEPGDVEMCLRTIRENYDSLTWKHSAVSKLRHFADESDHSSARIAVYEWVYEVSTCSACRSFAVYEMEKLNAVPNEWIPELKLDSEPGCREVAKRLGRRKRIVGTT